jgi:hypothetical protein
MPQGLLHQLCPAVLFAAVCGRAMRGCVPGPGARRGLRLAGPRLLRPLITIDACNRSAGHAPGVLPAHSVPPVRMPPLARPAPLAPPASPAVISARLSAKAGCLFSAGAHTLLSSAPKSLPHSSPHGLRSVGFACHQGETPCLCAPSGQECCWPASCCSPVVAIVAVVARVARRVAALVRAVIRRERWPGIRSSARRTRLATRPRFSGFPWAFRLYLSGSLLVVSC